MLAALIESKTTRNLTLKHATQRCSEIKNSEKAFAVWAFRNPTEGLQNTAPARITVRSGIGLN